MCLIFKKCEYNCIWSFLHIFFSNTCYRIWKKDLSAIKKIRKERHRAGDKILKEGKWENQKRHKGWDNQGKKTVENEKKNSFLLSPPGGRSEVNDERKRPPGGLPAPSIELEWLRGRPETWHRRPVHWCSWIRVPDSSVCMDGLIIFLNAEFMIMSSEGGI